MATKQEYLDNEKKIRKEHGDAIVNKAIENLEKQQEQPLVPVWCEEEGKEGKILHHRKHIADIEAKKKRVSYPKKYFCMYKRG